MREEYVNAIENTGAVLAIVGSVGINIVNGVENPALYISSLVLIVVGVTLIATAEWIEMKEEKKKKNKGHRTAKH